jgi:hypothetical protein
MEEHPMKVLRKLFWLLAVITVLASLQGCATSRAEAKSQPMVMGLILDPTGSLDAPTKAICVSDLQTQVIDRGLMDKVNVAGIVHVDTQCDLVPMAANADKRKALKKAVTQAMKEACPCAKQPKVTRCGSDIVRAIQRCDEILSREEYRNHVKKILIVSDMRHDGCRVLKKEFQDPSNYKWKSQGAEVYVYGVEPDDLRQKLQTAWEKQVKLSVYFPRERLNVAALRLPPPPPDPRMFVMGEKKG